jgi:hypothetical protein
VELPRLPNHYKLFAEIRNSGGVDNRDMIDHMAEGDGRQAFEVGDKQVVMDFYTVGQQIYYDIFVNGELVSKQGAAQPGEDHNAVLKRVIRTLEN